MDTLERKSRKIIALVVAALVAVVGFVVVNQLKADNRTGDDSVEAASQESSGQDAEKEPAPVPVEVAEARRGSVAAYIAAGANLVAENDVRVLAETEGRVTRVTVDEGQYVERGQILAELDRAEAELAAGKARTRAANAERAFDRAEAMRG